MLLKDERELKNWKFLGPSLDSVQGKYEAAVAIVRHVVDDLMGCGDDPRSVYDHFDSRDAERFRLDKILVGAKNTPLPNYGFIRFSSLKSINWHYVLHLAYKDEGIMPFSYAKEALEHYKATVIFNDQVRRGSLDKTKTRISQNILNDISVRDTDNVIREFLNYFITEIVIPVMPRTKFGFAHDVYAFFSDSGRIRNLMEDTRLDTIFSDYCLTYYDLLEYYFPSNPTGSTYVFRNLYNLKSVCPDAFS